MKIRRGAISDDDTMIIHAFRKSVRDIVPLHVQCTTSTREC